jgi:CheY-like chemotaxis protein
MEPSLILIVDDEEQIASYIQELLNRYGYLHVSFDNGEDVLDFLSAHADSVDLIITDIKMPGINGIELATKAAQIKPDIPVILITGYTDKLWEGITAPNVAAALEKPFFRTDLLQAIEKVLHNVERNGKRLCTTKGDGPEQG